MSFLTIVFACCRDVFPTILDFSGAGTCGRKSILDIIQSGPYYTRTSLDFVGFDQMGKDNYANMSSKQCRTTNYGYQTNAMGCIKKSRYFFTTPNVHWINLLILIDP